MQVRTLRKKNSLVVHDSLLVVTVLKQDDSVDKTHRKETTGNRIERQREENDRH